MLCAVLSAEHDFATEHCPKREALKPFLPDHVGQVSSGGGFRRCTAGGPRCKCQPLLKTLSPRSNPLSLSLSLSQKNCPRIRRQFSPPSGPDTSATGQACSLLHYPRSNTSPKGRCNIHCSSHTLREFKNKHFAPQSTGQTVHELSQIHFSLRLVR